MEDVYLIASQLGEDYAERIKRLRGKLGMTQQLLADVLGVSFATVNRWENSQTKPSKVYWKQLQEIEKNLYSDLLHNKKKEEPLVPILDFTAQPNMVKVLAEGERLSFGHLVNPIFATEISNIDPLPHQRIAVYDHMLKQPRLRFLLADDAGAGKTIMSGLYIREMISRRLLQRILIVSPAGLVNNWRRELLTLFNLPFRILTGIDARQENPFFIENSDRIIISIDTLVSPAVFKRLQASDVVPYDLVIFDEAHKLSANRGKDFRIQKTERYCLAEALAGVKPQNDSWCLNWSTQHLLLLTATPHMGKEYPYYALWRLLEPEIFSTLDAFNEFPAKCRSSYFIRRTKEEMVYLDGRPLYPKRVSDTFGYNLTQGDVSEQKLYDETTEYIRVLYNKAKLLNREAARLVMSVFQRRLASSTYALLRSFERRLEKLNKLIEDMKNGKLTDDQLNLLQRHLEKEDIFETKTADDEMSENEYEENEIVEEKLLQGVIATSLKDLLIEKERVQELLELAKKVHDNEYESKFEKLQEVIKNTKFIDEKFIIFTEHRDTLIFLTKRLEKMGHTGQVSQIHGGMHYTVREEEVECFRKPIKEGGSRFLICTDAAGEGINLQFCWIMINYDVPWNPARLEQRMGRIHRYGQKHDVIIVNLVASSTREGKVLQVLLDKIEKIRKELHSDKVFDCIGRLFESVSIKQYMEMAITDDIHQISQKLDGHLRKEQVEALVNREKTLYGSGGDVISELPRLRLHLEKESYFRLLPGYVRQYLQKAAPLVHIEIDGNLDSVFNFSATKKGALDPILSAMEVYPETYSKNFSVFRPIDLLSHHLSINLKDILWLHPGEPVFESFRNIVRESLSEAGKRGAVFVDPFTTYPYLYHLALISIIRKANPDLRELAKEEVLECRIVGVKQYEGAEIEICPVEHLLLLKEGYGLIARSSPESQRMALEANEKKKLALAYITEYARNIALERKAHLRESIPERKVFIQRGFDYQEQELADIRSKHSEKARKGNPKANESIEEIKRQQRQLMIRLQNTLDVLDLEPDLISPSEAIFIAHALVIPSFDSKDIQQHNVNVENIAMHISQTFEEASGAKVIDVHTPELALKAGHSEHPGFDLLSIRPNGEKFAIEVKGRAESGDVEVSENEWARACNMRQNYWLYVVYHCATSNPMLIRVQDPFGNLLAKAKGSVLIGSRQIIEASKIQK